MLQRNCQLVQELEVLLKRELHLHLEYSELIEEERQNITRFNADRVSALCKQRDVLCDQMIALNEQRLSLMEQFPNSIGRRLSELVQEYCHPDDIKRLDPLTRKLKNALIIERTRSLEFSHLAQFSLNLINGALSILWSATQHITRSYARSGKIKESSHPVGGRSAGVLEKA